MPAARLPFRGDHPPQKPAIGTFVNPAHPLARGLLLSCALNEDAGKTIIDSVSGRQFAATGAGWEGSEFSLRAATGRVSISGLPCAINASSKWSLVLRARGQSNSGGATPAVIASFNFDGTVNYWALAVQQYSNSLFFRGKFNNYADFAGGSHLNAGLLYLDVPETIVLVVSGYTATVHRADGSSYTAVLGASSDVSGGTITIGNTSGNTVYRRSIGLVQFYNRALTPDEADSILANPWAVYQPQRRVAPAATGGESSPVTGSSNVTLDPLTGSATGTLALAGTAAQPLDPLPALSTASLTLSGAASAPLADSPLSATGALLLAGQASGTLDPLIINASGVVGSLPPITASMQAPLGELATVASGGLTVSGGQASALGPLATNSSGYLALAGASISAFEGLAGPTVGSLALSGQATVTLGLFGFISSGVVGSLPPLTGSLAAHMGDISLSAAAALLLSGHQATPVAPLTGTLRGSLEYIGGQIASGDIHCLSADYRLINLASDNRMIRLPRGNA